MTVTITIDSISYYNRDRLERVAKPSALDH